MRNEYLHIFIAWLCILTGCSNVSHKQTTVPPVNVRVQVVTPVRTDGNMRYVGTVKAVHEIPLAVQTTGRVVTVECRDGERVRKGQVLLTLDSTQAVQAYHSAASVLRQAEDAYKRVSQVHASGAVTDQQMVEAESKLSQARSMAELARHQVEECTLRAPSEGIVSGFNAEVGESLLPGARIMTLLDMSGYDVSFAVPETEISSVNAGQTGIMTCAATGEQYTIRIREKNLNANPLAHTYSVRADITGETGNLLPGMVATVMLTSSAGNHIVVPAACIRLLPSGASVWVVRDGRAVRLPVEAGGYQADGVRISQGLTEGDSIIVQGFQKLYKGCEIAVVD